MTQPTETPAEAVVRAAEAVIDEAIAQIGAEPDDGSAGVREPLVPV
jgi:hypothetical protein